MDSLSIAVAPTPRTPREVAGRARTGACAEADADTHVAGAPGHEADVAHAWASRARVAA